MAALCLSSPCDTWGYDMILVQQIKLYQKDINIFLNGILPTRMNMHGDYIMILSDLIGCYIKRGGAPDRLQSWLATSATGIYIHIYIIVYGFLKPIRELNQKMQSHNQKHILLVKHISSRLRDLIPSPPTSINGCIFDFPSIHVCWPKWPKCIKQTQENCAGNHIYPTFVNIPACA